MAVRVERVREALRCLDLDDVANLRALQLLFSTLPIDYGRHGARSHYMPDEVSIGSVVQLRRQAK